MNYYNEHDPKAAAWLRELIAAGLIPAGDVDTRSITEVSANEISHYTQCHFFAGIGGWPLALELAGWPATRPVWTGSCPCQPFSSAGQGKGGSDDRHLWPVFRRLVAKLHPERVFGEQVAQAIGFNWLDGVSADLEADGYAVGAAVLGAHSVGAPHIRQRLYWVADSLHGRSQNGRAGGHGQDRGSNSQGGANPDDMPKVEKLRATRGMDKPEIVGPEKRPQLHGKHDGQKPANGCELARLGNAEGRGFGECGDEAQPRGGRHAIGASWARFEVVHCRDGKARRFEPESFPLADGLPGRVGLLRGYGNAIVPQVAAEFIQAFLEVTTNPTT
jgi:DNA (cytosine-5)-methyltransferase 1